MGRQSLRLTMLLGMLITGLGSTGVFAVFSDRVVSGWNSAETGSRPSAVDVVLATATSTGGAVECQEFSHELTTGLIHVDGIQPVEYVDADVAYACVRNVGSASFDLSASAIDLVDIDMSCTGDEAAAGDASCGNQQPGELAVALAVQLELLDCSTGASTPIQSRSLADWTTTSAALPASLAPDEIACMAFHVWVPATSGETVLQLAQSDRVEWQFAFDAVQAN